MAINSPEVVSRQFARFLEPEWRLMSLTSNLLERRSRRRGPFRDQGSHWMNPDGTPGDIGSESPAVRTWARSTGASASRLN
jgi:hypothetical protein